MLYLFMVKMAYLRFLKSIKEETERIRGIINSEFRDDIRTEVHADHKD